MKKHILGGFLLSAALLAPGLQAQTLEQQRQAIGDQMENDRQQTGEDVNAIRRDASPNGATAEGRSTVTPGSPTTGQGRSTVTPGSPTNTTTPGQPATGNSANGAAGGRVGGAAAPGL